MYEMLKLRTFFVNSNLNNNLKKEIKYEKLIYDAQPRKS